ncbi:MAG: hypothetical protein COS25_02855 [Candidatus Nealsonbacteria bacterium CG02_land_8_20_14_3_00_37_10]|uniref:DUF4145 domain-containing protein n=2 Tax=Candidatus Nealsoniibacteriota TaxID=1817911 RepID=A0A2G9YYY3_9BACT|nr:MAG: hypothetical protein COX35_00585 [Candidatus Nealsonbacteria bacterium CG23_combo_of_CG06-09_8_20_14_all_37_18]PIV44875.1 MAG: hypothetical protein COS25_02855 [Candidatus Nealsonbacteria bacterium CG02_land_8_20_14_3_00_37_10]
MEIIENFPENLIAFLISPPLNEWLLMIRIIFIASSLLLIGSIIFALLRSSWFKLIFLYDAAEILTYRPFGVKRIEKEWRKITARLDTGLESEYKLAVIEADNMVNETLKRMGYGGESLGERLEKLTAATLSNIEEIKEAHQVRNNIIHDPNYRLSLDDARKVLSIFEKAFKDLEAF